MKRIWGLLFTILGIFLAIQMTTLNVSASRKFQIRNYKIDANVQKNGDVEITHRINYRFDGDFHGVYFDQSLKNLKGITTPTVAVDTGYQTIPLTRSNSGKNNTYKVTKTKNNLNLKVYRNVSTSTTTFIYKYKLKGLVVNYKDTAELNWLVIDDWDELLKNIKITVNFPDKNISQLQAWSHGPLDGYNKVERKKGRVIITVPELVNEASIQTRMLFPVTVTPNNKTVINKNVKSQVQVQEKKYAEDAQATRKQQQAIYWSLMIFGLLVVASIYLYKVIMLKKEPYHEHTIPTPLYHSFDAPKFLPSFSKVILERLPKADSQSLTADLMNEVGKRNMKLEKVGTTFEITALKKPQNDFFKYLINDIGDGKKVTLRAIKREAQDYDGKERVSQKFDNWSKTAARGRYDYLDLHNMNILDGFRIAAITTDIVAVIMFLITMLFGKNLLVPAILLLVMAISAWLIYWLAAKKITLYTDKGEIAVNQIRAFKRMLEDIDDIKMAEVGDIILWEQFIPYAVAFGISDKVIKALKLNFTEEQMNQAIAIPYYVGFGNAFGSASNGFQSSFIGALGAGGSASISGGSGGFSGGSTGGFGGSSGGAF